MENTVNALGETETEKISESECFKSALNVL